MELDIAGDKPSDSSQSKPVVLLLLDGWGIASASEANIISLVDTTNFHGLVKNYPVAILDPGKKCLNCRYLSLGAGIDIESEEDKRMIPGLTKILSDNNLKQIKIAETERFAAATYYFNGWQEERVVGEEQKIISSGVDSPLREIGKETIRAIKTGEYDFILSVIADIDLIATQKDVQKLKTTIEAVDDIVRKIVNEVLDKKGVLIISSIGGNAERMNNLATDVIDGKMTNNPVPLIVVGGEFKDKNIGLIDPPDNDISLLSVAGTLVDITPTILHILNIKKPENMSGESLID